MFSKRNALPGSQKWNREFFLSFTTDLHDGGFTDIKVKLPINILMVVADELTEDQIKSHIQDRELTLQQFLDKERNYPAMIFIAKNPDTKEIIKILFGNISKETVFNDSTFPSGHSSSSTLYVQSPDPARVYPLFDFVYDHLTKQGTSVVLGSIFGFLSIIIIAIEIIAFIGTGNFFLQHSWKVHFSFDLIVIVICSIILYNFFKTPLGLSVNDRKTAKLINFLRRAIRGEYRDNPIISLMVSIIGTIVAALILTLIGLNPF